MTNVQNTLQYTGQVVLSIIAARLAPSTSPCHRALEREAMEMIDVSERDFAARQTFARRAAR